MRALRHLLNQLRHLIAMRLWDGAAARVARMDKAERDWFRRKARQVRRAAGAVLAATDGHAAQGDTLPVQSVSRVTWAHRPALWSCPVEPAWHAPVQSASALGTDATLYHDAENAEVMARQVTGGPGRAPMGLVLESFAFDGSYLSLAVNLPDAAWQGLRKSELVRIDLDLRADAPADILVRLNVRHGPNTEQMVREIDQRHHRNSVEFDLYYTALEPDRVSGMWVDLILRNPRNTRVAFEDFTLARRPRAEV